MKDKIEYFFKSLGLILLLLCFSSLVFVLFNIDIDSISTSRYILYMLGCNLVLLIIFIYIYRDTLKGDFKSFFKNFGVNMETSIKYWLVGFIIMVLSNLFITYVLKKTIAGNEKQIRDLVDMAPLFMIFDVIIYAPITEELIFRRSFKDVFDNKIIYILVSGLVFGGLHVINYIHSFADLIYIIPYGALGCTFATLYKKTDNIFSTISIHAIHNALAIMVYFLGAGL